MHKGSLPNPDELLVLQQRFHQGDMDAFTVLAEPHLDTLYTLLLRLTNDHARADDLSQEALIRAMDQHRRYSPGRALRPWLLTIATNLFRDQVRSAWWRRWSPFPEVEPPMPQAGPDSVTLHADRDQKVRACLHRLPPKYREALALFYLDGMSYREMTDITGVQVPALKQRVRRGREMLGQMLTKLYPELCDGS